jgi:two-component system NarL family response regulator
MIRVLVVDDHPVVARGISRLLEQHEGITVVGIAGDGCAAASLAETEQPDISIIDVDLVETTGFAVAQTIRERSPHTKLLFLSAYLNPEFISQAISVNAHGYLSKQNHETTLIEALLAIAAGHSAFCRQAKAIVDILEGSASTETGKTRLSPREETALRLRAAGKTTKEAAQIMGVSPGTIRTIWQRAENKLDLATIPFPRHRTRMPDTPE